jgi:hypothetical protein
MERRQFGAVQGFYWNASQYHGSFFIQLPATVGLKVKD